jgi:peptidoglycan/LPS O-acetylase OafA/YrhL
MRLIFAAQVVVVHAAEHFNFHIPDFVGHFPGVPAFFFVSGFLIWSSYLNAPGMVYAQNRFFRLFPGLAFVTLGGVLVALLAHGWRDLFANFPTYVVWIVAQTSIGQAYTPGLFRDIGVGAMNGSLWTLTTEILFYVAVPIVFWMERRFRFVVVGIVAGSFALYVLGPAFLSKTVYREKTANDVLALTPLVWGWMFGFGILAAKYYEYISRWRAWIPVAAVPLILMMHYGGGPLFASTGNRLGLFYFAAYAALIFWCAFAIPGPKLTFDLSYGVYIWHMPIINALLLYSVPSASVAFLLTIAAATLSWFLVEKPSLRLKRRSLKPLS